MSKGILLVLITALISGVSIFINKLIITGLNPYVFTLSKNVLVAIGLGLILYQTQQLSRFKTLSFKDWLNLGLIGLIGGSLPFLLFFQGLSQTTAVNAALIHKNLFIFVSVFSWFWLKEKLNKKFLWAAAFLILGNLFILKAFSFKFQPGDNLILAATILWALENILSKKLLSRLPALTVAFGRMGFGSLLIGVFLLFNRQWLQFDNFGLVQIRGIVITSLFLLGYVVSWYSALKRLPVSLGTAILTLGSPITTLLSLTVLGVIPAGQQIFGMLLFGVGVTFLLRQRSDYVRFAPGRAL
ncbi:DMT family transporter [Patescibacteria group bacterium]|nr:DMT family transporter [Patescibacteria group bacterium]MBU1931111.1 DMT family transporter [Patescibacteria group bacterium]